MIHYHGTPITPEHAAAAILPRRHAMVSFGRPEQIEICMSVCQSVALDNGAFTAWRAGKPIVDWKPFYEWIEQWRFNPAFDWFLIPDQIDGDEYANDELVRQCHLPKSISVPVWHMHESLDRIWRLRDAEFPRIAIGSSAEYSRIGTPQWWDRMGEAMRWFCDAEGRPYVKLHGLRMLDPKVFTSIPFSSADSTNVARNISLDKRWNGSYAPKTLSARGELLAQNIEFYSSPDKWYTRQTQKGLFS